MQEKKERIRKCKDDIVIKQKILELTPLSSLIRIRVLALKTNYPDSERK
jgi:hypothetical protein